MERRTRVPFPAEALFAWHERPGAFERLLPPWERAEVLARKGGLEGGEMVFKVGAPHAVRWVARYRDCEPGRQFSDEQVRGPFSRWIHLHRFEPDGPDACVLHDRIEYLPPGGRLGRTADPWAIRPRVERLLAYRHALLAADLAAHARYAGRPRLRIAITGASGLLGRALQPYLTTAGHEVLRIVRRRAAGDEAHWDYEQGRIEAAKLEGVDAVVHLAGENVGARWTRERRRRIAESRVIGTRFLAETLAGLRHRPRVLVSASGIGIYGDRSDELLTDDSAIAAPPRDFLSEVSREWEMATAPAARVGIRVTSLRFGVVLTPAGGVLGRLLLPFRLGLGGPIGGGGRWMSWVAIDDVLGAIEHALLTDDLSGPANVTAPAPVTNRVFASILGRVLGRPAVLPLPAPALRLVYGEMAEQTILASARVLPTRLLGSGYVFRHERLEDALRFLLGRTARDDSRSRQL